MPTLTFFALGVDPRVHYHNESLIMKDTRNDLHFFTICLN